jgi:hypothetical protein
VSGSPGRLCFNLSWLAFLRLWPIATRARVLKSGSAFRVLWEHKDGQLRPVSVEIA